MHHSNLLPFGVVYLFLLIFKNMPTLQKEMDLKKFMTKTYVAISQHSLLMPIFEWCWLHTDLLKKQCHTCRHAGALPWGLFTSTATSCQPPAASS